MVHSAAWPMLQNWNFPAYRNPENGKQVTVMDQIEELKAQLEPLQDRGDAIRTELRDYLIKIGRDFTRTSSGLGLGIVKGRVTYAVKKGMEAQALEWAKTEYPSVLSIAAAKVTRVAQPMLELPEFIERKEGLPHLSVRTSEVEDGEGD
jgi:hypothetical protein